MLEDLQHIMDRSFNSLCEAGDDTLLDTVTGYCADVIIKDKSNKAERLAAAAKVFDEIKRIIEEHHAVYKEDGGDGRS